MRQCYSLCVYQLELQQRAYQCSSTYKDINPARPTISAPRLYSTSCLTCVAITFYIPDVLYILYIRVVPPGMGMGGPACWRGPGPGCTLLFPPRRGRQRSRGSAKKKRVNCGGAHHISIAIDCQARSCRHSPRYGIIFYPLSFFLLPQGVGN
jgi:hypothetical protein